MAIMAKQKQGYVRKVTKTEEDMKRKRNRIKFGLNNAKPCVRISYEDDEVKAAFLDGLKENKPPTRSRSYLISRGMWAELEKLDASL